jgi:CheY-like chemotaxis protein
MTKQHKVLLVEDNRADARLVLEVFRDENICVNVDVVRDGEEAMAFLHRVDQYKDAAVPDLILLDLNLPKKDGRQVLSELKEHPVFRSIPVVVLTTSQSEDDVAKSYRLHASCYVTKPIDLERFTKIIKSLDQFWFSAVTYPPKS